MKKLFVSVLLLGCIVFAAVAQRTTFNNYTGTWENAASWVGGLTPTTSNPATLTAAHFPLTINGFITRTGNITFPGGDNTRQFVINDTLVVVGDLIFPNDAPTLTIGPSGLLIVIGDVSFANNTRVINNGIFSVTGDATFANGASEIYNGAGGGELFVQGTTSGNPDAQSADNWDNLDTLYPNIHQFMMCMESGGTSCVLPVVLSYFVAEVRDGVVELRWATTIEEDFQKFVIQRSPNGLDFEDIGQVPGRGFNIFDVESHYSFDDRFPMSGRNYYRLKAVDLDDSYRHFGVRTVTVRATNKLDVYPNPSAGSAISFAINFPPADTDYIVLTNQFGADIYRSQVTRSHYEISFPDKLPNGLYLLKYRSGDTELVQKILVR